MAVATSGDYEQNFSWRGRTYHHLLDASTASPRETSIYTLTITADRCLTADAAATAGFGLPSTTAMAPASGVLLSCLDRGGTLTTASRYAHLSSKRGSGL